MKRKVKNILTTFKEMWFYSKESTELVKKFSRLLPILTYVITIFDSVKYLGVMTFAGIFWGYTARHEMDIARNMKIVFWSYVTFLIVSTCFKYALQLFFTRKNNEFEYFIEDHFTELEHQKLVSVGIAQRITGVFRKINNRIYTGGLRSATMEFFKFRSKVVSMIVALTATMVALTFVNFWMIFSIAFVALISVSTRVKKFQKVYDELDETQRLENRSNEYARVITSPELYVQNFFFRTVPYFRSMFKKKRIEYRLKKDREEIDGAKADVKVSFLKVIPILLFAGSAYTYVKSGNIQSLFILFGCYKSLEDSVNSLFHLYSDYNRELHLMRDWKKFLATECDIDESKCLTFTPNGVPDIKLENVSFVYPGSTKFALQNVNLVIPAEQTLALTGNNGCGKSTLISLLTKIRLPLHGEVLFDSTSTKIITQSDIANFVCWIAGNSDLLELPLYEAVCGCEYENVDWERLNKAAEITGVNQFVSELSQRWFTSLDTTDQHHIEGFSDGQQQRLNLTAALYCALAPEVKVVIFDEPMAHCDTDIKTLFYQAIQKLGKTVIAAIHDPAYLHLFQRVIKLENGQVISDTSN